MNMMEMMMMMSQEDIDDVKQYNAELAAGLETARDTFMLIQRVEEFIRSTTWETKPEKDGCYHKKITIPKECRQSASSPKQKSFKAKTLEELKEKVKKYMLNSGKEEEKNQRHTLAEAWGLVIASKTIPCADPAGTASAMNSVRKYNGNWKRFFVDYEPGRAFADRYLDTITPADIEHFAEMAVADKGLRDSGLDSLRRPIRMAFKAAAKKQWIPAAEKTAYELADFRDITRRVLPKPTNAEKSFSEEDFQVIDASIANRKRIHPDNLVLFAYELQEELRARRSEICCLKWEDFTETHVTIQRYEVCNSMAGDGEQKYFIREHRTKTQKIRRMGLSPYAKRLLAVIKKIHEEQGFDSPFLFPDPTSETGCFRLCRIPGLHRDIVIRARIRYESSKAAGIPESELPHYIKTEIARGTHAFRRDASQIIGDAFGAEFAAGVLGHSTRVGGEYYYPGPTDNALEASSAMASRKNDREPLAAMA